MEPVIDPQPRRSNRPRKPTFGPDSDYMIFLQEVDDLIDGVNPISFKQAQKSNEVVEWQKAIEDELESMKKNSVWKLIKPHPNQKAIGSKIGF